MSRDLAEARLFQSEVAAIRDAPEPASARITLHALTALVAAAAVLMAFGHVDRTVSSSAGRIIATQAPSAIQALDTAIVKSIDVREGERVVKGQLLATLDPTFAAADVRQLEDQISGLNAQIAREEAELAGRPLVFGPGAASGLSRDQALQLELFQQRAAQYKAQIDSFDQKIATTRATLAKYETEEKHYRDREAIAKQIEDMRSTLLEKGAGSLLNLLSSTDSRIEALRTLDYGHNSLVEAQHQMSSLQADREAFLRQWNATTDQDLVTARTNRDNASAQLDKALKHRDLVQLSAQDDSIILTVAKINVGSILKEGDMLMTLVPISTPLEAEVQISTRDIGFLRPGDEATVKIDAFNFVEHGVAYGHVRWISEGAFTSEDTGNAQAPPYYKARIALDRLDFRNVPSSFRLIPGMTLGGEIKVGRRSLGAYVLGGMIAGLGDAMREP